MPTTSPWDRPNRHSANAAGIDLSAALLDRVCERSGGWPAGVRLAILHLTRAGEAHDLTGFGGTDRTISEYFASEVLERQTPEMRRFLQLTSVVDLICAELADAIVPGGRGHDDLEALDRDLGFVAALEQNGRWYRYHPPARNARTHPRSKRTGRRPRGPCACCSLAGKPRGTTVGLRHVFKADDWALSMTISWRAAS